MSLGFDRPFVFTCGCFDALHPGHVWFLEQAAKLGNLYVGLNSDRTIKMAKGTGRPIFSWEDRAFMLLHLNIPMDVLYMDEPTPMSLITDLRPKILVKGSDWQGRVVGQQYVESYGGKVVLIPRLRDYSTTRIVNALKGES